MDPAAYLTIALALACGAIVKGATGMGLPLVALPFLVTGLGLKHAIGVMLLPILLTNMWQVFRHRGHWGDGRLGFLVPMLVGGGAGTVVGTWLLVTLPERLLMLVLGSLLLGYVALRLARPSWVLGGETAGRLSVPAGAAAGMLQGSTGLSSPIVVTFFHAMRLGREAHVFAISTLFLLFTVVQIVAMTAGGVMEPEWWLHGLFALLPVLAFMPAGQWLGGRLSAVAFDRIILVFLGVMALKLVFDL